MVLIELLNFIKFEVKLKRAEDVPELKYTLLPSSPPPLLPSLSPPLSCSPFLSLNTVMGIEARDFYKHSTTESHP